MCMRWLQAGGIDYNVTLKATNNWEDPIRLASVGPPGGTLMEHRFCDGPDGRGPLMSDEQVFQSNTTIFPLWVAGNLTAMNDALLQMSSYTLNKKVTVGGG